MFVKLQYDSSKSQLAEIFFCVSLLFLMAQISIPLQPVPVTLQTLGIMIIGLKFGRKTAFSSVLAYLVFGVFGFPVFANFSGGYPIIIGKTGGYLIGFLPAVVVMGYVNQLLQLKSSVIRDFLSCLAGTTTVFVFGIVWLAVYLDVKQAIIAGLLPFIIPGLVKIFLLVKITQYLDCSKN